MLCRTTRLLIVLFGVGFGSASIALAERDFERLNGAGESLLVALLVDGRDDIDVRTLSTAFPELTNTTCSVRDLQNVLSNLDEPSYLVGSQAIDRVQPKTVFLGRGKEGGFFVGTAHEGGYLKVIMPGELPSIVEFDQFANVSEYALCLGEQRSDFSRGKRLLMLSLCAVFVIAAVVFVTNRLKFKTLRSVEFDNNE